MSDWFGVFLLLAVVYAVDGWLYSRGHNTLMHGHKTPHELRILEAQVRLLEREAGITHPEAPDE